MSICSVQGCDRPYRTGGFCDMHAQRMRRLGTTDEPPTKPRGSLSKRFWRKVAKGQPNECWEWLGGKRTNGYGQIQEGGKGSGTLSAHRTSYSIHFGKIPKGLVVMHKCDNPSCVNPNHLMLGTHKANILDMINKGRRVVVAPLGTENGKAVLDEEKVRFIRQSKDRHTVVARQLGVSPNAVRGVRIGRTWSHVK